MTEQDSSPDLQTRSRPKILGLLALLVVIFSLFHLFRFSQIILNWTTLVDLSPSLGPGFLAGISLVWGISGFFIAFSLWTGKNWARIGSIAYWIIYTVYSWMNLIWIVEPSILRSRWPVNLVLTIIGLGTLVFILNLKSSRSYFGGNGVKIP